MDASGTKYQEYQMLVEGKNINPQTLLATDYLNHFNEIHMLLGMICDMPDCLEDILGWRSVSYQEHFKNSVFQDKELAIEAYNCSPEKYRAPFETCVEEMDNLLLATIETADATINGADMETLNLIISDYNPKMERLIEKCSAIINSKETTSQQDVIDDYFDQENIDTNTSDQSAIDDLFD